MTINSLTKLLFQESPLTITYIENGLTNDNYRVTTQHHDVVIRLPKKGNDELFDYHCEANVLELIKITKLNTPLLYFDEKTGIKCTPYIEKAALYSDQYLDEAAHLIKTLHQHQLSAGVYFDLQTEFEKYRINTTNTLLDTQFAHHFIQKASDYSENFILCHNDLVQGNFLFSPQRNYLIDYEYARDNDPYFDLMSFLTENDIQDKELRARFYEHYFGHQPDANQLEKLAIFEIAHHVLWCQWAMMMYSLHHEPIYQTIAELKYKRLQECC